MLICLVDLPKYLYISELYNELKENDDGEMIDIGIMPPETDIVTNFDEFKIMCYIYDKWGLMYSDSFLMFMRLNKNIIEEFLKSIEDSHIQAKILLTNLEKSI